MELPNRHDSSKDGTKSGSGTPNTLKALRDAGPFIGLGIQLAAAVVLMFFLGRWLDERWGTTPWMMLAGLLFGTIAGMVHFIRTVRTVDQKKSERKNQDST